MKVNMPSFCGLDLQRDYFSIIQYSPEEQAMTLLSIQPFSAEAGTNPWKTWKNELKNSKGRLRFFSPAVICGMPSEYAVIKVVTLDADEENIAEAIEWEFGQQIVGSVDEYVFDYEEMEGAPGAAARKFLVVAYRQDQVNRMAGIVRSVKLAPQVIDLDIFGLVNIFSANYTDRKAKASLLVHTEYELTKLVLTRNGEFQDFHCFEHASGSIDAAGFAMVLSAEIDRFLAGAEKSDGRTSIYITGSYFQQAFSRDAFFEKVPQAELLNPFRTINCQVKIEEQQFQEYSTQLAVAAGLALRGGESK